MLLGPDDSAPAAGPLREFARGYAKGSADAGARLAAEGGREWNYSEKYIEFTLGPFAVDMKLHLHFGSQSSHSNISFKENE